MITNRAVDEEDLQIESLKHCLYLLDSKLQIYLIILFALASLGFGPNTSSS